MSAARSSHGCLSNTSVILCLGNCKIALSNPQRCKSGHHALLLIKECMRNLIISNNLVHDHKQTTSQAGLAQHAWKITRREQDLRALAKCLTKVSFMQHKHLKQLSKINIHLQPYMQSTKKKSASHRACTTSNKSQERPPRDDTFVKTSNENCQNSSTTYLCVVQENGSTNSKSAPRLINCIAQRW